MPTGTAARKAPRFRRTRLCGQPEDRRGHRLAANDPHSCLANSVVGQFHLCVCKIMSRAVKNFTAADASRKVPSSALVNSLPVRARISITPARSCSIAARKAQARQQLSGSSLLPHLLPILSVRLRKRQTERKSDLGLLFGFLFPIIWVRYKPPSPAGGKGRMGSGKLSIFCADHETNMRLPISKYAPTQ
jgi:hypothetical protein